MHYTYIVGKVFKSPFIYYRYLMKFVLLYGLCVAVDCMVVGFYIVPGNTIYNIYVVDQHLRVEYTPHV